VGGTGITPPLHSYPVLSPPNVFLHLREEVIEDVPSMPRGYKRDIPKFGKGQAVIKAPDVETVEVVGLPYCLTRHDN
jgi:hypothetical protein